MKVFLFFFCIKLIKTATLYFMFYGMMPIIKELTLTQLHPERPKLHCSEYKGLKITIFIKTIWIHTKRKVI